MKRRSMARCGTTSSQSQHGLLHRARWILVIAWVLGFAATIQGCTTAMQPAGASGAVIYTRGAREHTAMLQIDLPPAQVYAGLHRVIAEHPEFSVVNRNDKNLFVEIVSDHRNLSAQATSLSQGETLLFLWADAGHGEMTGQQLMQIAITRICAELAAECEIKND
jgi:hypothetical protein